MRLNNLISKLNDMPNKNTLTYIIIGLFILTIIICTIYNHIRNKKYILKVEEISLTLRRKIKSPSNHYKISSDIYNKLESDLKNEKYINILVRDILKHLKLPNNYVKVNLVDSINNIYTKNAIGQYGANTIDIIIKPNFGINEITTILAHECMHYYLSIRNIKIENHHQNELLTDIASMYLGFGNYYIKGYRKSSVGYLNHIQVEYLYNKYYINS